jgi:hypothetical protein
VHAFGAVQFTPEVDAAGPVYLLKEHDGYTGRASGGDKLFRPLHAFGVAGHHGNSDILYGHCAALLDVDDDQHGIAHDQWLCWHLTSSYRYSWIGRRLQ